MLRVLHEERAFLDLFIPYLLSRNVRAQEDLVDQLFNSSEQRLARTLLLLANYGKEDTPETCRAHALLAILFSGQCGRNCLRCSRVRNAESLLPRETTPSVWFPKMRQHYVSFCAEESSSPANKFRQGPRQPHRNWWSHEYSARAPKYWGRARVEVPCSQMRKRI